MTERQNRAVFLDRDGTIIEDADYLTRIEQIRILPGVPEALRRLREAGFLLLVVSNQSAIARGWLTEEALAEINAELNSRLAAKGASLDGFYSCPHLPNGADARYAVACECRKPSPGLILKAAREWNVDLALSFAVGDGERDVEAGRRAGCRTIRIGPPCASADYAVGTLAEAADIMLGAKA